jgi:hypothetical protein
MVLVMSSFMMMGLFFLFRRSPGQLVSCIKGKKVRTMNIRACRKYYMMIVGKIDNTSQIVPGLIFSISRGRCLMKYLSTDRKPFCWVSLDEPTRVPVVLIVCAGIEPVTSAPVARPGSPTFLEPDGKEELGIAIPQAPILVAGGQVEYGKGSHHRSIVALQDETVLYSKFEVAGTIERRRPSWFIEGGRSKEMKLYVGRYAIIQLQMRGSARDPIFVIRVLGRDVELPVLVFYCVWVVGPERRTGGERRCGNKHTEEYNDNCHE